MTKTPPDDEAEEFDRVWIQYRQANPARDAAGPQLPQQGQRSHEIGERQFDAVGEKHYRRWDRSLDALSGRTGLTGRLTQR